jgi:hypothetical protein
MGSFRIYDKDRFGVSHAGEKPSETTSKVIKIGGIIHAHFKFQGMNRSILKTSISSFIALVLVYYSVAWAVLRCSHDEDFANTATAVSDGSAHTAGSSYSFQGQDGAHLDCMGSDYHTETLGGFSAPLQQRLLSTDIASRVTDLSILHGAGTAESGNHWRRALSDGAARAHPIGPPRYLSLSVLRI